MNDAAPANLNFDDSGDCPKGGLSGDCPADLNNPGAVDVQDLLILLANWG